MSSLDRAQLSAIAATVDDLLARVAALGEELEGGGAGDAASAMFEAERALKMAGRALARAGTAIAGP